MNKNNENIEIIETSETLNEGKKQNSFKAVVNSVASFFKKFKSGKLKNQALFKKGGYSIAITALVLAGLMILNWWLMPTLATRLHLEIDLSERNKNSISAENIDYIKSVKSDVSIIVCAEESQYSDYMAYIAENIGVEYYSQSDLDLLYEYFDQTLTLLSKYTEYNKKINVKFVDPQSTEFSAITANYPNYDLTYGDMLITSKVNGNERIKVLSFEDIYVLTQDSSYASYGYISYTLTANRLETALTSAIAYVTSADSKKVAILSGHSNNSYTEAYQELLTLNNYDITEISDKMVTSISSDYDAIIICAPTIDFIGSELDVISDYLENDGKMGKGLIFFADAAGPDLPVLYDFLKQWGIEINDGLVVETDSANYVEGKPSTIGIFPTILEDDDITSTMSFAVSGYNVPMKTCDASTYERKATSLMLTSKNVVVAPKGASADWADYTDDDKTQFDCVIQSVESDYDKDNNKLTSYVMAFSSVEFVQSTWASYDNLDNQDIVMACTDRASHVDDTSKVFTSKVITNQSFASSVTENSVKVMIVIFMVIIPIATIASGIVIFIRRRNAR